VDNSNWATTENYGGLTAVERQIGLDATTAHPDPFRKILDIVRIAEWVYVSTFASVKTVHGIAGLRDLTSTDLPAIVDYWLWSPVEYLDFMGVNRHLLGSSEDIHTRFQNALRTGDPSQSAIALAITLDGRLAGYTLLNRYSEDVNYSHWHILDSNLRGKGLSTALYPYRIKAYFDVAPISRLIHQTRTRNLGVNRMLDKFVAVSETKFIDKPDGVASPGEFHVRFVTREDIPRFFARARELGTIPPAWTTS
jgi:RimJ/RimL family protein N-acetyltransferase